MSKKTHRKQLDRARQKRQQERSLGRKQRLVRFTVIGIIVAMVATLGVGAFIGDDPPVIEDPAGDGFQTEDEDPTDGQDPATGGDPAAMPARESLEPCPTGERPAGADTLVGPFDAPEQVLEDGVDYRATISTTCGDIVLDLFEQDAPIAVNSMVFLAQQDYYAGVPFHRTIWGFMVQGGDPTGTGTGVDQETGTSYPGYTFEDELDTVTTHGFDRGNVAMANAGPSTNGSQFFIVQGDASHLTTHTVFGTVLEGMEVVDRIAAMPAGPNGTLSPEQFTWITGIRITEA